MFAFVFVAIACANVRADEAHLQMSMFTTLRVTASRVNNKESTLTQCKCFLLNCSLLVP